MKSLLIIPVFCVAMFQVCRAQLPFSTIGQVYNFNVGDTFQYQCSEVVAGYNCLVNYNLMNIVISKNTTIDSLRYSFRNVYYYQANACNGGAAGMADTSFQIYTDPDSSIFWYHNPALHTYGSDTTSMYIDSVSIDSSLHNRKRDEHWESYLLWNIADTAFADGLGMILYQNSGEDFQSPQGGCSLKYYSKANEVYGTPLYFNLSAGVTGLSDNDNVKIFPNPAHGILNITSSGITITTIELYNITGCLLRVVNRPQDMPIDIYDVAPGIYYARIICPQGTITRKWVKL